MAEEEQTEPDRKRQKTDSDINSTTCSKDIIKIEWDDQKIIENISVLVDPTNERMDIKYTLPPELQSIDFTQRVSWHKYAPYNPSRELPFVPVDTEPIFTDAAPTLCHYVHAISGRARACTIHLAPSTQDNQSLTSASRTRPLPTPMFMPVGTKGCLKALTMNELTTDPALQCPIILANTYHLAIQPGTDLLKDLDGLHNFQGLPNILQNSSLPLPNNNKPLPYNLLTDSGGFQMVSLAKLSEVSEEGVCFENPYSQKVKKDTTTNYNKDFDTPTKNKSDSTDEDNEAINDEVDKLLLRPEDSIRHQNNIGSNILMALDDVISSVTVDEQRFVTATHRTLRWYDRCYNYHHQESNKKYNSFQNLFPIVQGGLDVSIGGLREQCLAGFRYRHIHCNYQIPGFSIGGLAGGEDKDDFWKVVDLCCKALPDNKPRYLMGVGYPLDLVVCTALGVDMYDCVYPTRTARFGVALVPGKHPGTLRLNSNQCGREQNRVIQEECPCQACRLGIPRARLHSLLKAGNPVAVELITQHNIAYMMSLVKNMRTAIIQDQFASFAIRFVLDQFPGKYNGGDDLPKWVIDALQEAGVDIKSHIQVEK